MAVTHRRTEMISGKTVAATTVRTGLIWLVNNGTFTLESNVEFPLGDASNSILGEALNAAGVRTAARDGTVVNSRANNAII